ncbi:MAG: CCA tRNA nucleotidyltransferase [Planctomycetota bacterium]
MERRHLAWDLSAPPWSGAHAVITRLREAGHVGVLVGGAVRDRLLGRRVHEVDVATDASPDVVSALFPRCVEVGRAFGVIVVVGEDGSQVEVASFRSDRAYVDGRRPSGIDPASEAEDVQRRDFTVNALIYDPVVSELRDHVGGLRDLEDRVLRVVGSAADRLAEDRLRVLRGLRFAAAMQLQIAPATWRAMQTTALVGLSRERILQEWDKAGRDPQRAVWWRLSVRCGTVGALCEHFADWPLRRHATVAQRLDRLAPTATAAVTQAAALRELGPVQRTEWLREQPLSRRRLRLLQYLCQAPDPQRAESVGGEDLALLLGDEAFEQLLELWSGLGLEPAAGARWRARAARSREPLISACDLLAAGLQPGPAVGRALRAVRAAQAAGTVTDRAAALALARRHIAL